MLQELSGITPQPWLMRLPLKANVCMALWPRALSRAGSQRSQKTGCSKERYRKAPYCLAEGPTPMGNPKPGTI